jgi:hypothetical protein
MVRARVHQRPGPTRAGGHLDACIGVTGRDGPGRVTWPMQRPGMCMGRRHGVPVLHCFSVSCARLP